MLQRFVGSILGALSALAILWISDVTNQADRMPWYVAAVVVGALVGFLWPAVAGFWFGRRSQERRDGAIEREVQRQLAEERGKKDAQG